MSTELIELDRKQDKKTLLNYLKLNEMREWKSFRETVRVRRTGDGIEGDRYRRIRRGEG